MPEFQMSRWLKEFDRYLPLKTLFLIHGNIYDRLPYIVEDEGDTVLAYFNLCRLITMFLKERGYHLVGTWDTVDGMTFDSPQELQDFSRICSGEHRSAAELQDFGRMIGAVRKAVSNDNTPVAFIINFASRMVTHPAEVDPEEGEKLIRILKTAFEANKVGINGTSLNNIVCLICDKLNDIPGWVFLNNPYTKSLYVDLPNHNERQAFFTTNLEGFYFGNYAEHGGEPLERTISEFVNLTHQLTNYDIENLRELSYKEKLPFSKPNDIITRYKFGVNENPWDKFNSGEGREAIRNAGEKLRQRVIGQDVAVKAVVDVVKRAVTGLAGIQHSNRKPKGVLFFAGPTGVGKTELAKALAELLFGNEEACIRFDMSEYSQPHSDEKLLGAPPGYVGYSEGGQLTNKVRENPFSVLLFDEIEKAHPNIMDKFLQILEDGRMTDGRGETTYFSETIIIFTSNLGAYKEDRDTGERKPNILPYSYICSGCGTVLIENDEPNGCTACGSDKLERIATPYRQVKECLMKAVEDHFKFKLGRPEIYNRIGNNFIVFDFIRAEIVDLIIKKMLKKISDGIKDRKKLSLEFGPLVYEFINRKAVLNLENGGRGVSNLIETVLINPLAGVLFERETGSGSIRVNQIIEDNSTEETVYTLLVE